MGESIFTTITGADWRRALISSRARRAGTKARVEAFLRGRSSAAVGGKGLPSSHRATQGFICQGGVQTEATNIWRDGPVASDNCAPRLDVLTSTATHPTKEAA